MSISDIKSDGRANVGRDVNIEGGDFVGRDKNIYYITVVVNVQDQAEEKRKTIRDMSSGSNPHALHAAHIAVSEGWHIDGSLVNAPLARANLSDVYLYEANLTNANLSWAKLERAELININFTGADLSYANLTEAVLVKADLTSAILYGANLTGAKLWNARLDQANLEKATIIETQFTWASFIDTKLNFANIVFAQESKDLFTPGLKGAVYNKAIQWPEGFDPKAAGAIEVEWNEESSDWLPVKETIT